MGRWPTVRLLFSIATWRRLFVTVSGRPFEKGRHWNKFAPQNLQPLRNAVQEELKLASTEGFTATEVEDGKHALLQERKLARTQDAGLADALAQQAYLGRTFAYAGEVDAAIAKLTPEAVNAALRKYLQPDSFAFVFAGDFAKTRK
jgi:zinc protease